MAGRGGAGIINNVLLSVCGDRPVSGHHARTQRGGQRVGPAYGTPAGCCFGACPEKAAENHHNGPDNEGAQRCVQRKHGAGDDVRAVRPPSRIGGRGGTPVGAQRGIKTIVYKLAVPGILNDTYVSLRKNAITEIEIHGTRVVDE